MGVPVDKLSSLFPPRMTHPDERTDFAQRWEELNLRAGEVLWGEGELATELGLVVSGKLSVSVDGREVGVLRPGDLVGEATVLCGRSHRGGTVSAVGPVEMALLPDFEVEVLGEEATDFHEQMLDRALEGMVKHLGRVDLGIARCSSGSTLAPKQAKSGRQQSLVRALLRLMTTPEPCPAVLPFLKRVPSLHDADPSVSSSLSRALEPQRFEAGTLLLREGDRGDSAFLLASGSVAVLRNVRSRRAEHLATLGSPAQLGTVCLVKPGHRTATCVAEDDLWVFRMGREAYLALPQEAGAAWKTFLLTGLAEKLVRASLLLSELEQAKQDPAGDLEDSFVDGEQDGFLQIA